MDLSDTAPRPKLASFLAAEGMDHYEGGAFFGCSGEYVRRMCLPFGHPRRCKPSLRIRRMIAEKSAGAVGVDDWDEPAMQERAA